jgi:hypothetical protein
MKVSTRRCTIALLLALAACEEGDMGGGCPDVRGTYQMVSAVGPGCGDLNTHALQCIQGSSACSIHFVSNTSGTGAVNGDANLTKSGSFTDASLRFGSTAHSGCMGSWNGPDTLDVTCGVVGTSQSCIVAMTRSRDVCP